MTFEEYMEKVEDLVDALDGIDYDSAKEELTQFQYEHMREFLSEYKKTIDCDARQVIYDIFDYAVNDSQTGSSIARLVDYNLVDEDSVKEMIEDILWVEIGHFMLDYEIYKEDDTHWVIDCMFGGYFVPEWDKF